MFGNSGGFGFSVSFQGHPSTVFCKISVRISKYRLKVSTAPERLNISG